MAVLFAAFHADAVSEHAYADLSEVDYLISCSCGHTIEQHDFYDGCARCTCPRPRGAALEALIETIRDESSKPDLSAAYMQLRPGTL
jgi:hypothetical protein